MAANITKFNSPNTMNYIQNGRSGSSSIKYIVLHYTTSHSSEAGKAYQTAINVFNGIRADGKTCSSDYIIDDATILQYLPDLDRNSSKAIPNKNGFTNSNSISIEMSSSYKGSSKNPPPNDPGWYFSDAVLNNTLSLCRDLVAKYKIPKENIKRHYDVNGKLCPGIVGWNPPSGSEDKFKAFVDAIYGGNINYGNSGAGIINNVTTLSRPYPWESDSDVSVGQNGKLYSPNNLSSGIIRFTLMVGGAITGLGAGGPWYDCVQQMGKWYEQNIHTYQGTLTKPRAGRKQYHCPLINGNVEDDCSSFVRACLQLFGVNCPPICTSTMQNSSFMQLMESAGFQHISGHWTKDNAQPGDILCGGAATHTEIYAGGGKSWGWGNIHDGINGHPEMPSPWCRKDYIHCWRKI